MGYGGGFHCLDSDVVITNCTIADNMAGYFGGWFGYSTDLTMTNTILSGNLGVYLGGGMFSIRGDFFLTNCTIAGNIAMHGSGGGLYRKSYEDDTVITNCTIAGNSAGSGGGLYNDDSDPTITNTIFWGNSANIGDEIYNDSGSPVYSYCDIKDCGGSGGGWDTDLGTDGGGNISSDPCFVNIFDFSDATVGTGTTTTIEVEDASLYAVDDEIEYNNDGVARKVTAVNTTTDVVTFANDALSSASEGSKKVYNWGSGATDMDEDLLIDSSSPCIDAADGDEAPSGDIDGYSRYDDPSTSNTGVGDPNYVDIGCYEYQGS